jgi:hypothetical protein
MSCSTSPRMSAGFHAERAPRAGTTPWPRCDPGQAHRPAALQPERAGASRGSRTPTVRAASAAAAGHGYTLTADGEITQLAEYVGPFSARAGRSPGISTGTRPSGAPPIPVGNRGRRYAAPGMPAPGPTTGRTRSSLPRITCCGSAGCTNCWSSATAIRTCTFRLQGCGAVSWTGIAAWPRCVPARGARSAWNPADIRGEVERSSPEVTWWPTRRCAPT